MIVSLDCGSSCGDEESEWILDMYWRMSQQDTDALDERNEKNSRIKGIS